MWHPKPAENAKQQKVDSLATNTKTYSVETVTTAPLPNRNSPLNGEVVPHEVVPKPIAFILPSVILFS